MMWRENCRISSVRGCTALAGILLNFGCTRAPSGYPGGKPITILVPYSAGGTTDATARSLAAGLEKELSTPVQIANKPGAASQIALTQLAGSKPDGYTFSYAVLPTVVDHYLDPERKAPYSLESFQPVALHWRVPGVIAVMANSPYKTLQDLVEAARKNPGRVTISDSGLMGNPHLMVLMLEQAANVKFASVHFNGGAPSVTALLGKHVEALAGGVSDAAPRVQSGELRVLAIAGDDRSESLPGVATMKSSGYEVIAVSVAGVVAPAGTPRSIVDTLSQAIHKVVMSDAHRQYLKKLGDITPGYGGPEEFAASWREYETRLRPLLAKLRER